MARRGIIPDEYASIFRKKKRKIEARVDLLRHEFADYVESIQVDPAFVTLPVDILFDVVRNYYLDLERMKHFHRIHNANRIKIAAYQTYWIARIKPIQVLQIDDKNPQRYILINEYFAINTLISQLYDNGKLTSTEIKSWNSFFLDQLAYHLHVRLLDARSLDLALVALRTQEIHPQKQ
jgi:hypothetical protein